MSAGSDGDGRNPPDPLPILKAAHDSLEEGFMLIDRADRIRFWNQAYIDMLELPPSLFADGADVMPVIRLLAERGDYGPGDPATLAGQILANVRDRMIARGERQMANGNIIEAEWLVLPEGHFMFRLRDVTSDRNASRFRDELIATVSHELRTPLTAIVGALGLLKGAFSEGIDARTGALVDMAGKNAERLTRLVNDLLDVDRLQAGEFAFAFRSTDIGALLVEAVEQAAPFAEGLGIALDLQVPDDPIVADLDPDRLLQVMGNLLSNAAKFSPAGSRVRIRLRSSVSGFRISVIDSGRGMSAEFARRIFTRFAQEHRDIEHSQPGTGLGLAICKGIIDRLGGEIHVDTRQDIGTIFHIDLPYSPA